MEKLLSIFLIYISIVVAFIIGVYIIDSDILNQINFLNWDAEHYHYINKKGYQGFRVAFFPLFPVIWKQLALTNIGISIFNGLIYLTSLFFLLKQLKVTKKEAFLYLSIPSTIFFFLPYSEALFFATSTLLIIGIKKHNNFIIMLGLLLCTLTRPAFTVFIPALIVMEVLNPKQYALKRILSYLVTSIIGVSLVSLIQYIDTGEWFQFFKAQSLWGNRLQVPELPLTSWSGDLMVRYDAVAFLIGICSGILVMTKLIKLKWLKSITIPRHVIFSFAYLGGITLSVLLFRGGSLFSLNRFVFAVPFIIVGLNFILNLKGNINLKQGLFVLLGVNGFWLLFGSYNHILTLLLFFSLSVYLLAFVFIKHKNNFVSTISLTGCIVVNIIFQFYFFIHFLEGGWVG